MIASRSPWGEAGHGHALGVRRNEDASHVIAISWNDRRNDPQDECFRPYVAMSFDGGQTSPLSDESRKVQPALVRSLVG